MSRTAFVLAAVLLAAGPAWAAGTEVALLPDLWLHLEAARYAPTAPDLHWTTWIGGGAGLFRVGGTTAYFTADVETTAGNTRRGFDATQANYHLEVGLRGKLGGHPVGLFLHHVSRHHIDRPKTQAVDWNVVGVRGGTGVPGLPVRIEASVGHTIQDSLVGYRWELTERADADLVSRPWGKLYLLQKARFVSAEPSPAFPRRRLWDVSLETGVRWPRAGRSLELFAAYEHRSDVLIEEPLAKDRALFGFRIGFARE